MIDLLSKLYLFLIVFFGSGLLFSVTLVMVLELLEFRLTLQYSKYCCQFKELVCDVRLFFIVGFLTMILITIGCIFAYALVKLLN